MTRSHSRPEDPHAPATLVVGAGLMGVWHAHALGRLGIGVAGVVDPDAGRARELARRAGGCPAFTDVAAALAAGGHRVAHVCTPLTTHVPLVNELLDGGMHVLVEKPLAATAEETRSLLAHAEKAGRLLCPVHQFLFQRGFSETLAALVEAGPILHVDAVAASAGAEGGSPERAEDVTADILPHPLSLMRRLLGPRFGGADWHVYPGAPGELRAAGRAADISFGILVSMRARPTRNTLRVMCEGGTFHVDLFHGHMVAEPPGVSRARKVLRPLTLSLTSLGAAGSNLVRRGLRREHAYPGLRELVARFHAATHGGEAPITPVESIDVAFARDELLRQRAL
jgi:predicted dehydrogenase